MSDARLIAEWDWVYTPSRGGQRLHHLAVIDNEDSFEGEGSLSGTSTCGRTGRFLIPGFMSRMGMDRCAFCCDRLGIKRGVGSPKNDDELRPWVEKRLGAAA